MSIRRSLEPNGLTSAAILIGAVLLFLPREADAQFVSFAETEPQLSIAAALDRVCGTTSVGDLTTQCSAFLGALGNGNENLTLQQVAHEEYANVRTAGADRIERQGRLLSGRVRERTSGKEGAYQVRESVGFLGRSASIGTFLSPTVLRREFDGSDREDAFDSTAWGLVAGIDRWVGEQVLLGVAVQFERRELDFSHGGRVSGGGVDVDSYGSTVYASTTAGATQVDFSAGLAMARFDLQRRLLSQTRDYGLDSEASARTRSRSIHGSLSLSRVEEIAGVRVEPWFSLSYVDTRVSGFREKGAAGFNLRISGDTVRSLQSTLELRIARPISVAFGVLRPEFRMSWRHAFIAEAPRVRASFVSDTSGFRFAPDRESPDRDHALVGFSLSWTLPGGTQPYVDYETVLGSSDVKQHTLRTGIRLEF